MRARAATGETFNKGGKTDILVRVEDVNAFIGERKKWKGAKALHEDDLPQLLRYRTWRDSKLALIYFCDRKDIHSVRDTVHAELPRVANFVRWIDEGSSSFGANSIHPMNREAACSSPWCLSTSRPSCCRPWRPRALMLYPRGVRVGEDERRPSSHPDAARFF